jgi:ABC-type transport system involved in cytochrome c biogenesis permease subunit
MAIKFTLLGGLIYLAMALHLLACVLTISRARRAGGVVYLCGFLTVVLAFVYRWVEVRHVPLQNLFEVFVALGMIYPLSLLGRHVLWVNIEAADMVLAVIVLFPAGFIFKAEPQMLPAALQSWLFAPHVAAYMLSYIVMAKAAVQAVAQWLGKSPADSRLVDYEEATYRLVSLGFPLLTLGLILGSYWGKMAWGDYWNWDPKEMWSLATWLVYLIYFHFRLLFGRRYPRWNSFWAILGLVLIVVTLLWVNLSRLFPGLHSYAQT